MPVDDSGQGVGEVGERTDVVELAVSTRDATTAQGSVSPSDPANSEFLRLSLMPRFDRSTVSLSSSMRSSSMKRVKPFQRVRAQRWPRRACLLADESQLGAQPYLEGIGQWSALFCCRIRRRSSALRPRLDRIECGNVPKRFIPNRSGPAVASS